MKTFIIIITSLQNHLTIRQIVAPPKEKTTNAKLTITYFKFSVI